MQSKNNDEKNQKHNRVNDITYQKFVDIFQSLQFFFCKYQQKMENPNTYSTYIRKKMKEKQKI
jgi:hypothetical protein